MHGLQSFFSLLLFKVEQINVGCRGVLFGIAVQIKKGSKKKFRLPQCIDSYVDLATIIIN